MKISEEIEMNLRRGAKKFLDFLDINYHSKYDNIVEDSISEMIKSENKDFMEIYNDYDRSSFVQYDMILMLFALYCENALEMEKIIKYRKWEIAEDIIRDDDIDLLLSFKKAPVAYINNLIENDSRIMNEKCFEKLFRYHMGYNEAYFLPEVIENIIDLSLSEEEEIDFEAYKKRVKEERKKRERKEMEDYYLKKRERKKKAH